MTATSEELSFFSEQTVPQDQSKGYVLELRLLCVCDVAACLLSVDDDDSGGLGALPGGGRAAAGPWAAAACAPCWTRAAAVMVSGELVRGCVALSPRGGAITHTNRAAA